MPLLRIQKVVIQAWFGLVSWTCDKLTSVILIRSSWCMSWLQSLLNLPLGSSNDILDDAVFNPVEVINLEVVDDLHLVVQTLDQLKENNTINEEYNRLFIKQL